MRYTTYEPQQNVYENKVKPLILSYEDWQMWLEFNRGMEIKDIARINQITYNEVNKAFRRCVQALNYSPVLDEPRYEPTCWKEAFGRKMSIIERFNTAPVVDGCKLVMSEL